MKKVASVPSKILRFDKKGNHDTYNVKRILGQGGFSTVYEVLHSESGKKFALKAIPLSNLQDRSIFEKQKEEIKIQQKLDHPNILHSYCCFVDDFNFYIVLELCPFHSVNKLFKKRGKLSEFDTADILYQVLRGVSYLHHNNIVHRDLKPDNFLIGADGKVKIADFGISVVLSSKDEKRYSVCGTKAYMCPEMVNEQSDGHSFEADIWSIGVCAYLLLTGQPPFLTRDKEKTDQNIITADYRIPADSKLSFVAKDFIQSILQVNPESRPTAEDLLNHPFITNALKTPHESILPKVKPPQERTVDFKLPGSNNENMEPVSDQFKVPYYCVVRYCDKSKKIGLIYIMRNGAVGIVAPDFTRYILDPHEEFVQKWSNSNTKIPTIIKAEDAKRVRITAKLFKYAAEFKKMPELYEIPPDKLKKELPIHHVKYWIKNDTGIMFRMDNKLLQVNYPDKNKLILFWEQRMMIFTRSLREKGTFYTFSDVKRSKDEEIKNRFEIAKNLINEMNGN